MNFWMYLFLLLATQIFMSSFDLTDLMLWMHWTLWGATCHGQRNFLSVQANSAPVLKNSGLQVNVHWRNEGEIRWLGFGYKNKEWINTQPPVLSCKQVNKIKAIVVWDRQKTSFHFPVVVPCLQNLVGSFSFLWLFIPVNINFDSAQAMHGGVILTKCGRK